MMEEREFNNCVKLARKICRSRLNMKFMEDCSREKILPDFTKVKTEVMKKAHLSKKQVKNLRVQTLNSTINSTKKTVQKLTKKFDDLFSKYIMHENTYTFTSNPNSLNFENITYDLKKTIFSRANYPEPLIRTQKMLNMKN